MAGETMNPEDIAKFVKLLGNVWPFLKLLREQLRSYESRVEELAKDVKKLRKEEKKVQNKVREEEKRNGRGIDDDVIKWLKEVYEVICEHDNFLKDGDRPYAVVSNGYLPKPGIRYRLRLKVIDVAKKVNALLKSAKHDDFAYWVGPPSFDADFDNIRYESFASRNQTMDDILKALAEPNVGVIGVYGWSGVGKTSLIKEVAREVKGNMFDEVIMVNITSRPDIRSIQGQVADKLGMKFEEESESGRAARLRERLKNPKEKTLIILDNIGVKLDFNMLGIPFENSDSSRMNHRKKDPSSSHHTYAMKTQEFDSSSLMKTEEPLASYKGCKILMISDSEQLLLSQMDGKGIQTYCVKPLTEKEAETMFKSMAEIVDGNSMFETLAAQIAKMCKGLPMTIVTTATALKNKSLTVWVDAHRRLERQNLSAMPEFSTLLSYDLLENVELKHTFLLCARMAHDALITDLVRNCIGLGLLQGIYTVREARDRIHALVAELKELGLLSDSFSSDRFTMQDMIRDAALSIASQQMHALAVTKGKLDQWPDKDKLERYTAISLQHCDVTDIMKMFPECINCSRLRVFHLDNKDPLLEIPDNFFNGMEELQVLILIGIDLTSLPSSIKCLKNLRMLCLERCKLGESLSIIGELKTLRVLSLSGSVVDKLPDKLKQLAKLQIFDISNCFKLKEMPANVLSSFTSLEELYMGNSPIQWKDQGLERQSGENASLSELRQLNQLTTLDILIPKVTDFPKNLFFDKLDSYRIVIGDFDPYPMRDFKMLEICDASRYLALLLEKGFEVHHHQEIKILFERVENLLLGQLNDVEDIFYELNNEGFPYLKYLSIVSNSKVKSIINSKNQEHLEKAFLKLESLFLYEVNNMEHICHSQLTNDSFRKLKVIRIKICGQLKNVFFSSMIKHVSALETIEVSECNSLMEIVTFERNEDQIKFPELRSLTLQSLSEFVGFYTKKASIGEQVSNTKPDGLFDKEVVFSKLDRMELSSIKITKIWNEKSLPRFYFQNLIHMDVNDCWNLQYLLSLSMSKSLVNLQSLFVSECSMMENLFKETEVIMNEEESIFPKLKTINLRSMKRLRQIWPDKFPLHSFGKLDALIIDGCNGLKTVFPSYMVGRFRSLCDLKVTNCKSMKEIFDLKDCGKQEAEYMTNLQSVHVEALLELEHVWNNDPEGILNFKNMRKVRVQECLNIKHIFPVSIAMGLKKLEYLEVWNCSQLKEIVFSGETSNKSSVCFEFPKLTTARFLKLPNLESFYGGTHELRYSTLNNLSVEHCHKFNLFRTEIENPETQPVFLPGKVIYDLKSMQIESRHAKPLKKYIGNYRMHKLEELQLSGLKDTEILDFFLHIDPNLKSLWLSNCLFKQLEHRRSVVYNKMGVVPTLKILKLMNLPSLEKIDFGGYMVLFRILECLILEECPCLNSIALPSVSFTYLIHLEVRNCNKLMDLMTPSTAKSLVQLTIMKVIQCESIQTIVSEPENDERIIFRQLKEIELEALSELNCFCNSSCCTFDFPMLEKCVVVACGEMEKFTASVCSTPVLHDICVRRGDEEKRHWRGDLNDTIKDAYRNWHTNKDNMKASNPLKAFHSSGLKTLKLGECTAEYLQNLNAVFTSLKNLEELEVRSSTCAYVLFGDNMKGYTFPLKKLTLHDLRNLERVWYENCDGILGFQNLQEVSVTGCQELITLFPVELAKKVVRLKKLAIRNCERFENIVEKENATTEATEEFSFPHLTTLNLCVLPRLDCFYSGSFNLECPDLNHLELFSSGNLKTFQSQHEAQASTSVNRLPLFPETKAVFTLESLKLDWKNAITMCKGKFPQDMLRKLIELLEKTFNLEYLKISRCNGLEELFPSQPEPSEIGRHRDLTNLIHDSAVPFCNLRHLSVQDCRGLKYLFTSSTVKELVHLEEMYIVRCESMEVIMMEETSTSEAIKFERLNKIVLDSLSSLSCFYSGKDTLGLSSLETVLVWKCPKLECFSEGDIHAESFLGIQVSLDPKPDLRFHQDLNTTVMMIQLRELFEALSNKNSFSDNLELQAALNGKVGLRNKWLGDLVTLKLDNFSLHYAIPSVILSRLNNLQELEVTDSDKVEFIFYMADIQTLETPSQLKKLTLKGLSKLTHVWGNNSQRLHIFPNLQEVIVSRCENLHNLFPSTLTKYLEKLEKLEIEYCDILQAIVSKEKISAMPSKSVEETVAKEANTISEATNLERLNTIVLHSLPSLLCFYSGSDTLQLPSLKKVHICECPEMMIFSLGVIDAESFLGIQISRDPNEEDLLFHQDLNATVKWMIQRPEFFKAADKECFSDNLELQEVRHGKVGLQNKWLGNLVKLVLDNCTLKYAIPSGVLPCLNNLRELEVRHSDKVEEIFHMNGTQNMETTFQLKKLTLKKLRNLVRVWEKKSQEVLIFPNLVQVFVSDCENLQTLFPASVAKNLTEIEMLVIHSCEKLQQIVEKEEGAEANLTQMFVFPRLEKLILYDLIQITSQTFTLECPALNILYVTKSPELELFQSTTFMAVGEATSTSINRQSLISNLKVISKVEELGLDWKHISELSSRFESEQFMEGLKDLKKLSLVFPANHSEKPVFPFEILKKAPNLTQLCIESCRSPEIFLSENPKVGKDSMLGQLEYLSLGEESVLQSIVPEDSSWLNAICDKLYRLKVYSCPNLTTLAHTASFSCLKQLSISNCPDLQYLFTSSAARNLLNLENIEVEECGSLKEIVAKEGAEDGHENEMIFRKLEILILKSLPKLESFYRGSSTLNFPSLKKLGFTECYSTKLFRLRDKVPTGLEVTIDGTPHWEGDKKSLIKKQFEEAAGVSLVTDSPDLYVKEPYCHSVRSCYP